MTLGRPCPVVPLGAGERSSVGGGGGWAQPTRPLPGFARQRACFSGRGRRPRPEKRRRPPGLPGGLPGGGGVWLSKKWLAPLFRGFHSSLAPTARPGSYARKPLLRKAFCGFDAHVAKSDYSLRGLRPPNPRGFFDRLKRGPEAKPPAPRFSGRFASSRRPPLRQSFLQRQKGKGKARPHDLWGLAHETLSGRGTATTPPLGQSPGPRYPGPGGFIRTAAGYNPQADQHPLVARRSPCAQHRRGRSTGGD